MNENWIKTPAFVHYIQITIYFMNTGKQTILMLRLLKIWKKICWMAAYFHPVTMTIDTFCNRFSEFHAVKNYGKLHRANVWITTKRWIKLWMILRQNDTGHAGNNRHFFYKCYSDHKRRRYVNFCNQNIKIA